MLTSRARRAASLVMALAAAGALLPLLARADHVSPRDPNDAKGPLDVRRIEVEGAREPRFTVTTWRGWTAKDLWDKGFVIVNFDTFGTERYDYYALVRSRGDAMEASLWRDRAGGQPDRRLAWLGSWKPSKATVAVRVPLNRMGFGDQRLNYRWRVQTLFNGINCRRVCYDFAPPGGVMEPIPGRTPTPTPTLPSPTPTLPSPTPSPTV